MNGIGGYFLDNIMTSIAFFQKGGLIMYVLLLCSLFVVAIGGERLLYFRRQDSGRSFAREFHERVVAGDYNGASALAAAGHGALPRILQQTIGRCDDAPQHISAYMEIQSGVILSHFRQRLYYLSGIVTMAPLLGLLGTISGMISAFSVFNVQSAQAQAITGGVGEALIATAFGLCVAIIALAVHAYFTQWLENIITDMEQSFSLIEADSAAFAKVEAAYETA